MIFHSIFCGSRTHILSLVTISLYTEQKLLEDKVQSLEKVWSLVEEESLKNPNPGTFRHAYQPFYSLMVFSSSLVAEV